MIGNLSSLSSLGAGSLPVWPACTRVKCRFLSFRLFTDPVNAARTCNNLSQIPCRSKPFIKCLTVIRAGVSVTEGMWEHLAVFRGRGLGLAAVCQRAGWGERVSVRACWPCLTSWCRDCSRLRMCDSIAFLLPYFFLSLCQFWSYSLPLLLQKQPNTKRFFFVLGWGGCYKTLNLLHAFTFLPFPPQWDISFNLKYMRVAVLGAVWSFAVGPSLCTSRGAAARPPAEGGAGWSCVGLGNARGCSRAVWGQDWAVLRVRSWQVFIFFLCDVTL